jgi:hypothetical protein
MLFLLKLISIDSGSKVKELENDAQSDLRFDLKSTEFNLESKLESV